MRMLLPRPEAAAKARRRAASPAGALVRGGPAYLFNQERVDAAIGIVARDAGQAAVNHTPDAVDGQRSLGDVGGDDDLALVVARHCGVLLARREVSVQGEPQKAAGPVRG